MDDLIAEVMTRFSSQKKAAPVEDPNPLPPPGQTTSQVMNPDMDTTKTAAPDRQKLEKMWEYSYADMTKVIGFLKSGNLISPKVEQMLYAKLAEVNDLVDLGGGDPGVNDGATQDDKINPPGQKNPTRQESWEWRNKNFPNRDMTML